MQGLRNLLSTFKKTNENVLDYFQDYQNEAVADPVITNFKQKMEFSLPVLINKFIEKEIEQIDYIVARIKQYNKKYQPDDYSFAETISTLKLNIEKKQTNSDKKIRSHLILALFYHYGCGETKKNTKTAMEYYQVIKDSCPIALRQIALMCQHALINYPANYKFNGLNIVKMFEQAVKNGDNNAAINLGCLYKNGMFVKVDLNNAREYFVNAAEAQLPRGLTELGILYAQGIGVRKNITKAEEYFKRAAIFGDAKALNELATLYHNKAMDKVELDSSQINSPSIITLLKKAEEYMTLAADSGYVKAMSNCGRLYKIGFDHGSRRELAAAYYRRFFLYEKTDEDGNNVESIFKTLLFSSEYCINLDQTIVITRVSKYDAAVFYYWAMASKDANMLKHAFYADPQETSSLFEKEYNSHLTKDNACSILNTHIQNIHAVIDPLDSILSNYHYLKVFGSRLTIAAQQTLESRKQHRHKHYRKHRHHENKHLSNNNSTLFQSSNKPSPSKSSDSEELISIIPKISQKNSNN